MKTFKIVKVATIPCSLDGLLKGQLSYFNQFYDVIGVSSSGKELENVALREGVRTVEVNMKRRISPFHDIVSLIKLYFVFKNERPHMVHSITPKAGLLSMIAAKASGVPIRVHTFTGLVFPYKGNPLKYVLIYMDRLLCYCATHVIPEGEGVRKDLELYNITRKPLKVIANGNVNGVNLSYFDRNVIPLQLISDLKDSLQISFKDFVFVFVGRIVKDKGIEELVNAFMNLNRKDIKLLLVGPYEDEIDPISPKTKKIILESANIIHVGFQEDVRPYYTIANLLVFPSYREGFPNVVLEGGAMGLPTIATDICGCNEIIKSNENGILIPKKNEAALREAMQLFYDNPNMVSFLASNARICIEKKFTNAEVWTDLHRLYEILKNNLGEQDKISKKAYVKFSHNVVLKNGLN